MLSPGSPRGVFVGCLASNVALACVFIALLNIFFLDFVFRTCFLVLDHGPGG